ncbi:3-hydroxyacyl-CoA dehydrogenase [Pseudomonas sp. MPR-R2A5]|uniref:3-hydroxyacyl-CoA dehydrogenase n=1 Tax=Pseudomonas sp. MPR-R2A5 TaxID=2070622 RepID=UPI000C87F03E|nr:3-hydroxyacyl-CoA dehydrogenase [Pseudomonas sp. MPR-R2A5]PMY14306.1 3-hydroxyacyl-CoA dehydrogenase [Pseudomonas sp. MPR-R2A5]
MTSIHRIGVVGAGAMGRGIVQLFSQAGHPVSCFDAAEGSAQKAVEFVHGMIDRAVLKGRHTREEADAICASISACNRLEELAGCDLVIEAVVEDLGVKRDLFRALEEVVGEHAILASNTSSLVVSDIAAGCRRPERVAGLHFFNPVPLMKVAEVIAAVRTAPSTVEALKAVVAGAGHRAVVTEDQPGFLVNHAGRGLYTEGLRLLEERAASPQDVDTLMREAAGFRMGPFELLDLTGLDVSGKVMESIYQQFHQEPRFRPSSLIPPRVGAGLYGRKTGEGWYRYQDNMKQEAPRREIPPLRTDLSVWIDPAADDNKRLQGLVIEAGIEVVEQAADGDVLVVQFWGTDTTRYCVEHGLDAARTVAVDPLPGLDKHRTLMLSSVTRAEVRDAALAILAQQDMPVTVISDSCGFVLQRILAMIVNIAADIAQRGIASVEDIEDAVRLGLGYPQGPLSLGDAIGGKRVLNILTRMHAATGDPRYRPSPWLSRRVALGLSLLTAEVSRR